MTPTPSERLADVEAFLRSKPVDWDGESKRELHRKAQRALWWFRGRLDEALSRAEKLQTAFDNLHAEHCETAKERDALKAELAGRDHKTCWARIRAAESALAELREAIRDYRGVETETPFVGMDEVARRWAKVKALAAGADGVASAPAQAKSEPPVKPAREEPCPGHWLIVNGAIGMAYCANPCGSPSGGGRA